MLNSKTAVRVLGIWLAYREHELTSGSTLHGPRTQHKVQNTEHRTQNSTPIRQTPDPHSEYVIKYRIPGSSPSGAGTYSFSGVVVSAIISSAIDIIFLSISGRRPTAMRSAGGRERGLCCWIVSPRSEIDI